MEKKKKRVYISAPIRDYELKERMEYFQDMEEVVKVLGGSPVSPMKNGLAIDAPYEEHMKRDLELLRTCDIVILLKGWEQSKGCMREYEEAKGLHKVVMCNPEIDKLFNELQR